MLFLHDSELHFHGNLKSSNCVVTSCWTLQVADYGLLTLRHSVLLEQDTTDEYVRCKSSFPFMSSLELLFLFFLSVLFFFFVLFRWLFFVLFLFFFILFLFFVLFLFVFLLLGFLFSFL